LLLTHELVETPWSPPWKHAMPQLPQLAASFVVFVWQPVVCSVP